jgi:hypothetical protein
MLRAKIETRVSPSVDVKELALLSILDSPSTNRKHT